MRRLFFLMSVSALLCLAGCSKEDGAADRSVMERLTVTVLTDSGQEMKSSSDSEDSGRYADQCRLQIYSGTTLYYDRTAAVTDGRATFNDIQLDRAARYDYLFWADNEAGHFYETGDLHHVTLTGDCIVSDCRREAFFGAALGQDVEDMCDTTLLLRRPFAQLRVATTDVPAVYDALPDKSRLADVLPDSVRLTVSQVASCFDVSTGTASDFKDVAGPAPVFTTVWNHAPEALNVLQMNYFFASSGEDASLIGVDFGFSYASADMEPVSYHWTNIPLRQNWRTNIKGDLLTACHTVEVRLAPDWNE